MPRLWPVMTTEPPVRMPTEDVEPWAWFVTHFALRAMREIEGGLAEEPPPADGSGPPLAPVARPGSTNAAPASNATAPATRLPVCALAVEDGSLGGTAIAFLSRAYGVS